jgi:hypothetical protein
MKNEMNFDFDQELNAAELTDVELDSISGGSRATDVLDAAILVIRIIKAL